MQNSDSTIYVYDGRDLLGTVRRAAAGCDAFDARGNHLGAFPKLKPAVAAVHAAQPITVCGADARRDGSP